MKKSLFGIFFLFAVIALISACSSTPDNTTQLAEKIEFQKRLYKHSLELADVGTATLALNTILVLDSSQFAYYDTLAGMYYTMGGYLQAIAAADRYLKKNPKNTETLDLIARCEEKIGNSDTALILYTQLFEASKKMKYKYKMAQFNLAKNDIKLAQSQMDEVFKSQETDKDTVDVAINDQGLTQPVPLRAAAFNMQAFIYLQQGNAMKAKKAFEDAVKQYPDFQMAKYYLQELPRMMQGR